MPVDALLTAARATRPPVEPARVRLSIGILTFHRCINYGSYWQARCLAEGLRARGHDAVLLDHRLPSADDAELACALQPLLPVTSACGDVMQYAAKIERFRQVVDELPLSPPFALDCPETAPHHDLIVVGSDEVWNLAHPWYGGEAAFFGEGLRADRLVSYAASVGNVDGSATFEDQWVDLLRGFDAISVRDETSRYLVQQATGRSPAMVLDPCLQFPPEPAMPNDRVRTPYLAVYGHSMPDWFAAEATRWAHRRGLAVLSIGYRNDWADEQHLSADPLEFAALIGQAAAVATNFFHGCVFALLREKPFVCAASPYRLNKVRDLTTQLGASSRLLSSEAVAHRVPDLLDSPLEADIAAKLGAWRARSNAYLDEALG